MRALILAKIEGTYGTDPTPTKVADAILTTMPTFEVVGKSIERKIVMPHFGSIGRVNVGEGLKISFQTEVAGSGTATVAPRISPLLVAAGFTEAVTSKASYTPNSLLDSVGCTIHFYVDGRLHHMHGCVVESMKITAKAGEYATIDWSLIGKYDGAHASDVALPTDPTYLQPAPPVFKSAVITIGAYSPLISAMEISVTNTIGKSYSANAAVPITRYRITNRAIKGSMDPEAPVVATWNPWTLWDATTVAAIAAQIGATTGNILTISVPAAHPTDSPKYQDRETIGTYQYGFSGDVTVTAGNNELVLEFT
jgi:hypothetical protein